MFEHIESISASSSLVAQVDHTRRTAVFENMETKTRHTVPYAFLHAVPPQPPPPPLRAAIGTKLVNADGYVDVDQFTLTHKHYPNVWGVGDCIGIPSSKTAAAACMSHINHMFVLRVYIRCMHILIDTSR